MNLLFTCAGRRGYLLRYFAEALGGRGLVHAVGDNLRASAFMEADRMAIVPPVHSAEYIPALLDYCRAHEIAAVMTFFDADAVALAESREEFAEVGTVVVGPDADTARTCDDKWIAHQFLREAGFNPPRTFLEFATAVADAEYPVYVKPRAGCGSIGVYRADNIGEMAVMYRRCERDIEQSYVRHTSGRVLAQEALPGAEHRVEILCDMNGRFRAALPQRTIALRAGESDVAETLDDPVLYDLGRRLAERLVFRGAVNVNLFYDGEGPRVLEINPRFGGSYPFSHLAGANYPAAILAWLEGREADPAWLTQRAGVIGMKALHPVIYA